MVIISRFCLFALHIFLLWIKLLLITVVVPMVCSFAFLLQLILHFISRNYCALIFLQEFFIPIVWSYFLSLLASQMERKLSLFVNVSVSNESTFLVIFFGVGFLPNFSSPIENTLVFGFPPLLLYFLHPGNPQRFLALNLKCIQLISSIDMNLFFWPLERLR